MKWRGNWRMEWVASTLHITSEHGVSSITTADAHTSAASSRLNWRPCRFQWTRPFRRKAKFGFCACANTFQMQSTNMKYTGRFFYRSFQHGSYIREVAWIRRDVTSQLRSDQRRTETLCTCRSATVKLNDHDLDDLPSPMVVREPWHAIGHCPSLGARSETKRTDKLCVLCGYVLTAFKCQCLASCPGQCTSSR